MGSELEPEQICKQASQSILALAQSYDSLFSLRRIAGLIPYFVSAAGLFNLALEVNGSNADAVYLRTEHMATTIIKTESERLESKGAYHSTPRDAPNVKILATAHAQSLLETMSIGHPAAKIVTGVLQEDK